MKPVAEYASVPLPVPVLMPQAGLEAPPSADLSVPPSLLIPDLEHDALSRTPQAAQPDAMAGSVERVTPPPPSVIAPEIVLDSDEELLSSRLIYGFD